MSHPEGSYFLDSLKDIGLAAAQALTIAAVIVPPMMFAIENREMLGDMAHTIVHGHEPREDAISRAIYAALGVTTIVRCSSGLGSEEDADITGDTAHFFSHTLRYVRIREDQCDIVTNLHPDPSGFLRYPHEMEITLAAITIGHEAAHVTEEQDSEPYIECIALQHSAAILQALGISEADAYDMAQRTANENEYFEPDDYIPPPECRENGMLDLDPTTVGIFPHTTSAANA